MVQYRSLISFTGHLYRVGCVCIEGSAGALFRGGKMDTSGAHIKSCRVPPYDPAGHQGIALDGMLPMRLLGFEIHATMSRSGGTSMFGATFLAYLQQVQHGLPSMYVQTLCEHIVGMDI